jgi:hypothetical protein
LAQNDYQTFGDSGTDGTNKLSLTNYVADNDRIYGNGYTTKLLRSQLVNKVLQQTSKISSAVAQFLVNNGISALDTDSSTVIATNIDNSLNASRNTATHAATSKTTPVSADEIAILDSASSFSLKKLTWGTFASIFAPLASPALTGIPTAPTATARTNNTQIANTAYVDGKMVLSTSVATTSGTSIDFTGIPSWVRRVTIIFSGVSTNGTSSVIVQIGSGSVVTSGYLSGHGIGGVGTAGYNTTTGFGILAGASAAHVIHGHMTITLFTGNTYTSSHSTGYSDGAYNGAGGGTVTANGAIDRIRLTTVNGTDAFDAGSINIMYEG